MENRPGNTFSMNRRLGSTTYKITVHFSDDAAATMEDKILRIIRNSADTADGKCDIMDSSQMGRQSERSAS